MIPPWCNEEACGHPRDTPGKPRRGWVAVRIAADGADTVWFCSPGHAGVALLGEDALVGGRSLDVPDALNLLNQLAATYLTVMTATPSRVRVALDRACARVLAQLDDWQARQERLRPTLAQLSAEASTGRPTDDRSDNDGPDEDRMDGCDVEPGDGLRRGVAGL